MNKYKLGLDKSIYIECLKCEKRSFSPGDIKNLYCPTCGFFFEQVAIAEHVISEIIKGAKSAGCYTDQTEQILRQTLKFKEKD